MFALSFGAFFCVIVGLVMSFISIRQDPQAALNRTMALMGLSFSVLAFSYIWLFGSTDQNVLWFFYHLSSFVMFILIFPLGFVANMIFARTSFRQRLIVYFPFGIFWAVVFIRNLFHPVFTQAYIMTSWGNRPIINSDLSWIYPVVICATLQQIVGFVFLLRQRKRATSQRIKSQIGILVYVSMALMVVNTIQEAVSRAFNLPTLDLFQGLLSVCLIFFLMARYGFLGSPKPALAHEVLQATREGIVVVDSGLKIQKVNPLSNSIFGNAGSELIDRNFTELVDDPQSIRNEWAKAVEFRKIVDLIGVSVKSNFLDISLSPSFDEFGDLIGGIIVIRNNRFLETAFTRFGITTRERDIAISLLQGYSRNQIAESKFIAPGTVKIHIHNIYEKTGATNRVELMLIFQESK